MKQIFNVVNITYFYKPFSKYQNNIANEINGVYSVGAIFDKPYTNQKVLSSRPQILDGMFWIGSILKLEL